MRDCYLKKNIDFQRVYKKRNITGNRNIIAFYKKNNLDNKRLGFTITKKVGNAVTRNRLKRQFKDIYYNNFNLLKDGYDYVFVIKKSCLDISYKELEASFRHICRKLNKVIK